MFPNSVGSESTHADIVGDAFYGRTNTSNPEGVAYGLGHVDNWIAGRFYYFTVAQGASIGAAKVANQSFLLTANGGTDPVVDQKYDNYVETYGTIFVSGIGNGPPPSSPATCYNGIGVAAFGGASSVGPTTDNARSKPDITAPATVTSYSTPLVTGAAAILVQAAGTTPDANDPRTVKALLLNGAIKPLYQANAADRWTHSSSVPLDMRYGAGVLNVFNSYQQLQGGRHAFTISNTSTVPPVTTGNVGALAAWDFNSLTSTSSTDKVNHYFFDLTGGPSATFTVTSTLVWDRQNNQASINNLDLFLYRDDATLIASSVSPVDNVEHLFVQGLPPGRYDLEVFKRRNDVVGTNETYALAFDFAPVRLVGAVSRKVHGSAGTFDVALPLTGAPGIECRAGGVNSSHQVVLTFAAPVTFNKAEVTAGAGSVASTSGSGTNSITINLSGVSNAQMLSVTLFNVNDGTRLTNAIVQMGVLLGDVTGDGFVLSGDYTATRQNSGNPVQYDTFRYDVNADGFILSGDYTTVRAQSGTQLP